MSKISERLQEIKAHQMYLDGNGDKFHQNLNLLFAIILGIIIPELALLVAMAWLFGWLKVHVEKRTIAFTGNV